MPTLGAKSKDKLKNVHPKLIKIVEEAIKYTDFTVLEGLRSIERQEELVKTGKSKTMNSKHLMQQDNYGHAVDLGIWLDGKVEWNDTRYYYHLAGIMKVIAKNMNVTLRWGGDWDSDGNFSDQTFDDLVHFEIIE